MDLLTKQDQNYGFKILYKRSFVFILLITATLLEAFCILDLKRKVNQWKVFFRSISVQLSVRFFGTDTQIHRQTSCYFIKRTSGYASRSLWWDT